MKDRILTALTFVMMTAPALAQSTNGAIHVPEPATITVLGVAAAGAFIARKYIGRK